MRTEIKRFKVVSGGQSGVDRAALDFALKRGLDYGGWCPRGGWAEDFPDPPGLLAHYPRLRQTPSAKPERRTAWNVRDSDATLIIVASEISASAGSAFTLACVMAQAKPHLLIDLRSGDAVSAATDWLERLEPATLNIAGPRESESPGIYRAAAAFLDALLYRATGF